MKVIQISPEGNFGSVGTIAEEIGKKLIENNESSYIAYAQFDRPSFSVKYKIGNILNRYIHAIETRLFDNNGLSSRISTYFLINWIKKISPDIIHIHQLHGYYINYRILFNFFNHYNIPIILTLHDCWLFTGHCTYFESINCTKWKTTCHDCELSRDYPKSLFIDRSTYNFQLKKQLLSSNNNIYLTSVSKWLASKVSESFLSKLPNQVIYNGIDTSIFTTKTELSISPYKDEIFQNKFIIIGVANPWDQRKGLNDFIELSRYLNKNQIIVLIGITENQNKYLPDNIIGITPIFDKSILANYYKFSNIFINFSIAETFGLTTVEAMACGLPAIVYNNTAFPEIVKHGKTGYLINHKNFLEVSKLINNIENTNEIKILQDNCVEWVNENFNLQSKYNEYVELYNKIYTTHFSKKNILLIATFPPPITGQSIAVSFLKNELSKKFNINYVNLSKDFKLNKRSFLKRIYNLFSIFFKISKLLEKSEIIYFTISESFLGNIKDLIIFWICRKKINNVIIHLHGGENYRKILNKYSLLYKLNLFFLKKLKGIIILGETFKDIFNSIEQKNIHIIHNFAQKNIFLTENVKFKKTNSPLEIIFVSNHLPGKGYLELIDAFELLSIEEKNKINISFAGDFNSVDSQSKFLNKISKYKNIKYLGVIEGVEKINLFNNADIFCLPTYYAFEGQPISIIEAYASGCAVITTNHSGIKDIFTPGVNGLEVEICNSNSLSEALRYFINNPFIIKKFQIHNFSEALKKYTEIIHLNKLISIIEQ